MMIIPIKLNKTKAFLIKDKKNILVDTGGPSDFHSLSYQLDIALEKDERIDTIIITHAHSDHYGSAASLKEKTGAEIVIHRGDYECMKNGYNSEIMPFSITGKLIWPFVKKGRRRIVAKGLEADRVIDSQVTNLAEFGIAGKIVHTPGHTPGSISLFLEDKTAIVGDLMMSLYIPEKPERPLFASNVEEWKDSLKRLLDFEPKKILVTHGNFYVFQDFFKFAQSCLKK